MNDRMFVEILVTIDELSHYDEGLVFRELFPFLKNVLQGATIAKFLEKVNVVGGFFNIKEFNNIIVLDRLHDLDFVFE
jgi:hypothetical protein